MVYPNNMVVNTFLVALFFYLRHIIYYSGRQNMFTLSSPLVSESHTTPTVDVCACFDCLSFHHPVIKVPHRPPALRDGPFGWGTDWIVGVGLPGPGGGLAEDVIEPAWCQASAENRSFVEAVMERRVKGPVDRSNRVRHCGAVGGGLMCAEWLLLQLLL